jgi:hypothetical protein
MPKSPNLDIRTAGDKLAELGQLVDDCRPCDVRSFEVDYEGKVLDYGAAVALLRERRN